MDKPLSFSGYRRYMTCPHYYYLYDIKKQKPGKHTSALVVGTIVDDYVMAKLEGKDYDLEDAIQNAYLVDIDFYDDDSDMDLVDHDKLNRYTGMMKVVCI